MGYNPPMKLLLSTLHSKYVHSSLALPSLAACCGGIPGLEAVVREYTVNERPETILPRLVAEAADVAAFSCYIWNIEATLKLVADLKLVRPGTFVILGGPEVSYGSHELLGEAPQVDCIVRGEGEETFRELMTLLAGCCGSAVPDELLEKIDGISFRSGDEIVTTPERGPVVDLGSLPSPFGHGMVDTAKQLVYLETSRGCPFSCAFCISSVDRGVRSFPMERIEADLALLMAAGVQTIKLVDRTFNFDAARANRIWEFVLENNRTSRFHFEIAADLLTDDNISLLRRVPPDTFRFEIGVQSADEATLASVGRKSGLERLFANLERLKRETSVTLHLDLVAGLPGEDFAGFTASLGRLLAAAPHHIQVEPLKLLKGTRMRSIAREQRYAWSPSPPYRILSNPWLSYGDICRIEAASHALELFHNSGRFAATLAAVARALPLAAFFTAPAVLAEIHAGGGNGLAALFASLRGMLAAALPPAHLADALDALRFDYCMAIYPGKALPAFLYASGEEEVQIEPPVTFGQITGDPGLKPGERFKTFAALFGRDHTSPTRPGENCRIVFLYSGNGSGGACRVVKVPTS